MKMDKTLAEFKEYIIRLENDTKLNEDAKISALYAWVEQKVHNELAREYNRNYRCSICGAEKEYAR